MLHQKTLQGTHRVTDRLRDRLTDTAHISNNSLHLMHLMQPNDMFEVKASPNLPTDIEGLEG